MAEDKASTDKAVALKETAPLTNAATLREVLAKNKTTWSGLGTKFLPPARFEQLALLAFQNKRELFNCTIGSVIKSLNDAARLGLEPDSPAEHGWIIPYRNNAAGTVEAQFQVGYKGLIEEITRSDAEHESRITSIYARIVHDRDEWEPPFEDEIGQHWKHRAYGTKQGESDSPGEMFCAYSVATYRDGHREIFVMTKQEIEWVRDTYSKAYKSGKKDNVWITNPPAAWLKTVIRHHGGKLPKTQLAIDAFDYDRNEDAVETTFTVIEGGKSDATKETKPADDKKGGKAAAPPAQETLVNGKDTNARSVQAEVVDSGEGPQGEAAPPMDDEDEENLADNRPVTSDELQQLQRAMKEAGKTKEMVWLQVRTDPRGKECGTWKELPFPLWRDIMKGLQKGA